MLCINWAWTEVYIIEISYLEPWHLSWFRVSSYFKFVSGSGLKMKNRLYTHVQAQTVSNRLHFLHSHLPHPLYLSQDLVYWECVCVSATFPASISAFCPSDIYSTSAVWNTLSFFFHMTLKMSVQEDLLEVWLIFCAFVGILALFYSIAPVVILKRMRWGLTAQP